MARKVLGWVILILLTPVWGCTAIMNLGIFPQKVPNPAEVYKTGPYADWENYLKDDPKAVQWGQALYGQNCRRCHGEKADGNSMATITTFKEAPFKPANLTTGELPDGRIMHAVTFGTKRAGMASYGTALTEWERAAIIAYIRTLPKSDFGKMSSTQ